MRLLLKVLLILVPAISAAREVAITIDDLPRAGDRPHASVADTERMTAQLLRPFRAGRIPVTGFVNECRESADVRGILTLWKAAGAELGNHTCSHPDLNTTPATAYEADIVKGETVTTAVLGTRPRWFRHPMLHAGKDRETRLRITQFLTTRGYRVAPVTLDNADYVFAAVYARALDNDDESQAARVRAAYVAYMESIFEFFERRSVEVTGHEVRQVLLIHASQLNTDAMPELLSMMKRREYRIVTLERALEDDAYTLPDNYDGPQGFSWIHRWSETKGMAPRGEPNVPASILQAFHDLRRN